MNKLILGTMLAVVSTGVLATGGGGGGPPALVEDAVLVFDTCQGHPWGTCVAVADLAGVDVADQERQDDALEDEVEDREDGDAELAGQLATTNSNVTTNTNSITSINNSLSQSGESVGAVANNVRGNTKSIATNSKSIAINQSNIGTNRSMINSNSTRLDGVDSRIDNLSSHVGGLATRLSDLDNEVAGLGAQSAALSSLPQAYGVGKNMLSVGVGHYRGANALAVGYSRRFTKGLVTKFGFAFSEGKASNDSFNASVGYEF